MPRKAAAGFSLLELLVTITIMSVLMAVVVPTLQHARERTKQIQCISNMRQIGVALRGYQNDHKGKYPQVIVDATHNWQTYLADPTLQGIYLSGSILAPDGAGESKFKTSFLCPTIVKRSDFRANGYYWGYAINGARTDISYNAGGSPWFDISYQNSDLDEIYKDPARAGVMIDGNQRHFGGGDWNAFTSDSGWWDWTIVPIHNKSGVNVLFLDGHIEFMNVASTADRTRVNQALYGQIPGVGNPWL